MPARKDRNRITGEETVVYRLPGGPFGACFGHLRGGDQLLEKRKAYATAHQDMAALQKACAMAGDTEGARFFKEEAAFWRRRYNAALWVIPHFVTDPPGDCKPLTEPWYWPIDLADDLDAIVLARGA